jgi:two-component system cell cycle response regulator DivK
MPESFAVSEPQSTSGRRWRGSVPGVPDTGVRPRPRVLLVDDDEDICELYGWCMRAAGWLVESATSGEEALFVATDFAPDVIVMDLRLPVIGGLDAARLLKSDPHTRHIPIVAISATARSQAEAPAKEAGCEEFVAKPCPPERLRAILEDLVTGRRGSST